MRFSLKVFVFAVSIFLFCGNSFGEQKLTKITENVYAYVDTKNADKTNSFGANAGIIIGNDGIAVVDTLLCAKEAKRFIKDIRSVSRKPIKYVINTHHHLDHVFGNSEFARKKAIIISQETTKKLMEQYAQETLDNIESYGITPEDIKGTKIVYPSLTFGDRMEIDLGGEKIELIHAPYSHTGGDTLVYVPGKKVLFTGDILFTGYHPYIGEGDIESWAKELDAIKTMDAQIIVPGHGPVSTKSDLDEMKKYIILFDKKAKELVSRSNDAKNVSTEIQSFLPRRSEAVWLIEANIQGKYLKKQEK